MVRRLFDGVLLALIAWFITARLEVGEVALALALGVVAAFTAWRVHRLWRKYRSLLRELAVARQANLSDDPAERQRAERILRSQRMIQAAEIGLWSGFVMGAAGVDGAHAVAQGGAAGGYEGIGGEGGMIGGDFGGGFDGGGM